MNRRSFMRAVVTSPLVGAVAVAIGLPRKYGRIGIGDVRDMGYLPSKAKVYLNGQELPDCFLLDDIEGWAEVYSRNAEGYIHMNTAKTAVVTERRYGQVRFVPKR